MLIAWHLVVLGRHDAGLQAHRVGFEDEPYTPG